MVDTAISSPCRGVISEVVSRNTNTADLDLFYRQMNTTDVLDRDGAVGGTQ